MYVNNIMYQYFKVYMCTNILYTYIIKILNLYKILQIKHCVYIYPSKKK